MSAKDMFYPEDKEFSVADKRAFAREELVYNVTEDILVTLEDMGITKKELARRLGRSKSYVTQILSGIRNMTLGTLSDICFALEIKPKVFVNKNYVSNHIVIGSDHNLSRVGLGVWSIFNQMSDENRYGSGIIEMSSNDVINKYHEGTIPTTRAENIIGIHIRNNEKWKNCSREVA